MNLRALAKFEFSSKVLRNILTLFYTKDKFYKVPFGCLKGLFLKYKPEVNYHVMLGLWESDNFQILRKVLKPLQDEKLIIADVGSNLGYYSLFFNRYTNERTQIFAFEPSDSIYPLLNENLKINRATKVVVVKKACSNENGIINFFIGAHHHQSSILGEWSANETYGTKVGVEAVRLDNHFNDNNTPDFIKIDVEGAGSYVLEGCQNFLKNKKPIILIESHTADEDNAISNFITQYEYEAYRISNKKMVLNKDKNYKDKDGVWGQLFLIPSDKKDLLRLFR